MIDTGMLCLIVVFWLLFMGRTAMLMRQGVKVFVLAKGKSLKEKVLEFAMMPLFTVWTLLIVCTALRCPFLGAMSPVLFDVPALQWVGLVLCAVGVVIFVAALVSFGSAWRVGIDEEHSDRLVTGGIFGLSRNPIFVFMNMFFCGVFLVYPTVFFLLFFLGFAVGIHVQILNEEKFLRGKFGAAYEAYTCRVRRYL